MTKTRDEWLKLMTRYEAARTDAERLRAELIAYGTEAVINTNVELEALRAENQRLERERTGRGLTERNRATRYFTVKEAAAELCVSKATLNAWMKKRKIGHTHLGRSVRIPASEIQRIVDEGFVPPSILKRRQ